MKELSKGEKATAIGLSAVALVALGGALLKGAGVEKAGAKTSEVVPVSTFKSQLEQMGVHFEKVRAYQDATGVQLVTERNAETGSVGTDVESGKKITDTTVHLSPYAIQRLAQIPAGEGTGEKSIIGPDGVQEHDIQFSAQKDGGTTDVVDLPVVPNQQVADALDGALPPVADK